MIREGKRVKGYKREAVGRTTAKANRVASGREFPANKLQQEKATIAIYCFAWEDGGAEERKLSFQEKVGRTRTRWRVGSDENCEVYSDATPEVEWDRRPSFERLIQEISDGRIGEVWALGSERLFPFRVGEEKSFEALCKSMGVEVSFGRF